jgi:hypothetical protein
MNNIHITNNITLDKRNPPPLTVSCAPSGGEGPTVYIQTKERKKKNKKKKNNLVHVQIIIPVGCQIFRRYVESRGKSKKKHIWDYNCPKCRKFNFDEWLASQSIISFHPCCQTLKESDQNFKNYNLKAVMH